MTNEEIAFLHPFMAAMAFIFGLLWGSFFNVCIYRLPIKLSVSKPARSFCFTCGSQIAWYDNIPLLSYLLLRGKCRSCGSSYSSRYFFIELLTGLLFLLTYMVFGPILALPFHLVFVSLLIIGFFTDVDHFILPDSITLGGMWFALATSLFLGSHALNAKTWIQAQEFINAFSFSGPVIDLPTDARWIVFLWSCASAIFGYGLLYGIGVFGKILFRKEAMGVGDMKLFALLGAYLGALNCIWILFLSAFVGTIIGGSLLIAQRFSRKQEYEDIVISRLPAVESQWLTPEVQESELREYPPGPESFAECLITESPTAATDEGPVILHIARNTSSQMHHFPYGPYIAIAALLVLYMNDDIYEAWKKLLFF